MEKIFLPFDFGRQTVKVTVTHGETILECAAAGKTPLRLYGKDVVLENKLTATV